MNYKKLMALFMSMVMVSSCVMPVCAEEFQAEENISVDFSSESSGEEFSDQQASVAAPIQQDMDGISGTDEDKFEQSVIPGEAIAWIEQSENSDSEAAYAGNTALPYEIEILGKTELSEKESEEPSARSSEQEDLKEDSLTGMAVLIKDPGKSAQELMDELMKYPQVKGVEPNYMISISSEDEFTSPEEFSDASDSQSEEEQPEICDQIKEDAAFSDQEASVDEEEESDGQYIDMTNGCWMSNNQGQFGGIPGTDIQISSVWENYGTGSDDVVVAVIDTGIDLEHPDLRDQLWTEGLNYPELVKMGGGSCGLNTVAKDSKGNEYYSYWPDDDAGHGSHCAGIIGASWNKEGTSGVAENVKLMSVKVMNDAERGEYSDIYKGLFYVLSAAKSGVNVKVLNYSLGNSVNQFILKKMLGLLGDAGVICCIASGNNSTNLDTYITNSAAGLMAPETIVVDALTNKGEMADFSNYGYYTHVFAPGYSILSTVNMENSSYIAPFAKGNILYDGFEETEDVGTDRKVKGQKITFCRYDEYTYNHCGIPLENVQDNKMLGYRSIKVSDNTRKIISTPVSLKGFTNQEKIYLSLAGVCIDFGATWVNVSLIDRYGNAYQLNSNKDDNYFYKEWHSVYFSVPSSFNSWDSFQIQVEFLSPYKDFDINLDCLGIGSQMIPYDIYSGTSMAAPVVTGTAALLSSIYPDESADTIAAMIRGGVAKKENLNSLCLSGGYINVEKAVSDPGPVIQSVVQDGESFSLEGHFFGDKGTVLVNGQAVNITDYSEGYIRAEIPEGLKQNQVEIRLNTDHGWTRYFAIMGFREDLFRCLPLPGDKSSEQLSNEDPVGMTAVKGKLFYISDVYPDGTVNFLSYDIASGKWKTFLKEIRSSSGKAKISLIGNICGWNGYLYLAGTFGNDVQIQKYDPDTGKMLDSYTLPNNIAGMGKLFVYKQHLMYMHFPDSRIDYYFFEVSVESHSIHKSDFSFEKTFNYDVSYCNIICSGNRILLYDLYHKNSGYLNSFIYYNGEKWNMVDAPADKNQGIYFSVAAGALKDGFIITGPVKKDDSTDVNWKDTWFMTDQDGEVIFKEADRIFCPSKCSDFMAVAYKGTFYVLGNSFYGGGRLFRCMDGVKTLDESDSKVDILNGWQKKGGRTYYYRNNKKLTGWQKIDGKTYYFWPGGKDSICNAKKQGEMVTGWLTLRKSGRTFYLWDGNKAVKCNAGQKGQMCTGWVTMKDGSRFYFKEENSAVKTSARQKGQMCTGWVTSTKGNKFYFWTGDTSIKSNAVKKGQLVTGKAYNKKNKTYYYFDKKGKYLKKVRKK